MRPGRRAIADPSIFGAVHEDEVFGPTQYETQQYIDGCNRDTCRSSVTYEIKNSLRVSFLNVWFNCFICGYIANQFRSTSTRLEIESKLSNQKLVIFLQRRKKTR
jgi:hypothetical protein